MSVEAEIGQLLIDNGRINVTLGYLSNESNATGIIGFDNPLGRNRTRDLIQLLFRRPNNASNNYDTLKEEVFNIYNLIEANCSNVTFENSISLGFNQGQECWERSLNITVNYER